MQLGCLSGTCSRGSRIAATQCVTPFPTLTFPSAKSSPVGIARGANLSAYHSNLHVEIVVASVLLGGSSLSNTVVNVFPWR